MRELLLSGGNKNSLGRLSLEGFFCIEYIQKICDNLKYEKYKILLNFVLKIYLSF